MNKLTLALLIAGLGTVSVSARAADGYVDDSADSVVRTGYGDCLHTQRWSIPNAIVECDPEIVAKRDGASVAAVEVVLVTLKNPIRLEADTLFDFDKAELTDEGKAALDDLLGQLTAESLQQKQLQIHGYTDKIGSDAYNMALSEKRAASVRDYLVEHGVVPAFIATQGFGKANPVVDCPDKRGSALIDCLAPNRRTEIEFSAMEVKEVEETRPLQQQ